MVDAVDVVVEDGRDARRSGLPCLSFSRAVAATGRSCGPAGPSDVTGSGHVPGIGGSTGCSGPEYRRLARRGGWYSPRPGQRKRPPRTPVSRARAPRGGAKSLFQDVFHVKHPRGAGAPTSSVRPRYRIRNHCTPKTITAPPKPQADPVRCGRAAAHGLGGAPSTSDGVASARAHPAPCRRPEETVVRGAERQAIGAHPP